MTNPIASQVGINTPLPAGLTSVTNPLYPAQHLRSRVGSFSPEIYDLSSSTHLYRLLGVLLGDSGGEQLSKLGGADRLRSVLTSTQFLDLDAFWGAIFNIPRATNESYPVNPTTDVGVNPYQDATIPAIWRGVHRADAYFRGRIFSFVKALSYGASPVGIKGVAEAILSTSVDLYETFNSNPASYMATIVPHRVITQLEKFTLHNIFSAILPADTTVEITQGQVNSRLPVTLAQAWSTSNYWSVSAFITPGQTSLYETATSRQRYAFSGYQGDSWTLNGSIVEIDSQVWNSSGTTIATTDFEHYPWPDGSYTNFTADLSIIPAWKLQLGRMASPGILSASPVNPDAPLLIDGFSATELATLLSSTPLASQTGTNHYWSTTARNQDDPTQDVVIYTFDQPHLISEISFQTANFPHTATIYGQSSSSGLWYQIYQEQIATSSPPVFVDSTALLANHQHPQHSAPDSWINVHVTLPPSRVSKLRIVLQRSTLGVGPVDTRGVAQPYSLAVQNFGVSAIIGDQSYLPVQGGLIDTTVNLLGDTVQYSTYTEDPNTVLNLPNSATTAVLATALNEGTVYSSVTVSGNVSVSEGSYLVFGSQQVRVALNSTGTTVTTEPFNSANSLPVGTVFTIIRSQWRCNPQPSPSAVVNYYFDTRESGSAQLIDSIYVEPTHIGVTANLYWTEDSPTGDGPAVDEILPVTASGVSPASFGLTLGASSSLSAPVTITGDWWVGLSIIINPDIDPQTSYTLASFGGNTLTLKGGSFFCTTSAGDVCSAQNAVTSSVGAGYTQTTTNLIFGYALGETDLPEGPQGVLICAANGIIGTSSPALFNPPTNSNLVVGAAATAPGIIVNFVVKGETLTTSTAQEFMTSPRNYCYKGLYGFEDSGLTVNSYARFDVSQISQPCPYGVLGGTPDVMANLNWQPLVGDFIITRGLLSFRPTLGTFWKIEMTNLVAEPISTFLQVTNSASVFSSDALFADAGNSNYRGSVPIGVSTQIATAQGQPFFPNSTSEITSSPDARVASPSSTAISTDPATAFALAERFHQFKYTAWGQSSSMPITTGGPESYVTSGIQQSAQMGFFCGFYLVQAFRESPSSQIDRPVFNERFYDRSNYIF